MPLVTCPGCGRMVSDKAGDCPRCGCTLAYVRPSVHAEKNETAKPIKYVRPQVDVYVPIGDGTRDRGEKLHTLYFNDDGISLAYQYNVLETYNLSDIVSVDCYKADKPRNNDTASMAAAGLVLGGVVGAVAGGIVGAADQVSWYFEVVTKNSRKTFRLQAESHKKNIVKWAVQHGLMTESGESVPRLLTPDSYSGGSQYELSEREIRLIETYRKLRTEFQMTLQEQADSLFALQTRVAK